MSKRAAAVQKAKAIKAEMALETKTFWHDFREFAFKGDVLDLAVGIIIGGAFNKIVQSLTNDVIMPVFGKLLGNAAFTDLFINLNPGTYYPTLAAAEAAGAPVIKYGVFISNVLDFLIVSLSLFIVVRFVLQKRRQEKEVEN